MRVLGGWIALTPELSAKLLMGRHVWDNAQHADAWGRRLPELRAQAHASEPPTRGFVAFVDALEGPERPEQTVERLVGIYRVLKPSLLGAYEAHLERTNAVYEPPTRRILARCIEDERRHVAAGETVLRHLVGTPALEARARAWQTGLERLLEAAGGVSGGGLRPRPASDPAGPVPLSDDAREFIRLEQSAGAWPIPDELTAALGALGDALVTGDLAAARRWLAPEAAPGAELQVRLREVGPASHRLVACARVGRQRLVKLRLEGACEALTLLTRWVPAASGWRAVTLEPVSASVPPAP